MSSLLPDFVTTNKYYIAGNTIGRAARAEHSMHSLPDDDISKVLLILILKTTTTIQNLMFTVLNFDFLAFLDSFFFRFCTSLKLNRILVWVYLLSVKTT